MSKHAGTGGMILPIIIGAALAAGTIWTLLFNGWWHWPFVLGAIAVSLGGAKMASGEGDKPKKGKK